MSPQDLDCIRASQGWREHRTEVFHDTSQGTVLVKGQRAAACIWRHHLMNLASRLTRLPMLAGDPMSHGARAQRIEVERLHCLAAAGVPVPVLLHVDDEFFVMQYVPGRLLTELLRGEQAVANWQRGLNFLADVHRRGQYLGHAFTRNLIADGDRLVAIDFESDLLLSMSLDAAQARDWLTYLYSSMKVLPPSPVQAAARLLRTSLAGESQCVRQQLGDTARRLSWVLRMRGQSQNRPKSWRRQISILQVVVGTILGALADEPDALSQPIEEGSCAQSSDKPPGED